MILRTNPHREYAITKHPTTGLRQWTATGKRVPFSKTRRSIPGKPVLAVVLMLFTITVVHAQSTAERDAETVGPFVGETTFLVLKVDPKRLSAPELPDDWNTLPLETRAAFSDSAETIKTLLARMQVLADDQPIFGTASIPTSSVENPFYLFRHKTSKGNAEQVSEFCKSQLGAHLWIHDGYLVAAQRAAAIPAPDASRDTRARIIEAFHATEEFPIQMLIRPPSHVWRTISELSPELPRVLGGGPSQTLTDGVQWASIGADPGQMRLKVIVQSANEEAAQAFAARLPKMLSSLYAEAKPIHPRLPASIAKLLIDAIEPQVESNQVAIRIEGIEKNLRNLALLDTVAKSVESNTRRNSHVERFRQILLGMHNYHDVYRSMPPGEKHRDKDGKPFLSWRVHILPFVEQQPLYNQFHLDEPWDSPHNKKLIEKMPDIYACSPRLSVAGKPEPGHTTFLAPIGEKTIFGGDKVTKLQYITDGTSNTVAILEASPKNAVPWTAPADYEFDAENPLAGVLIGDNGQWLCALADGSVHHLPGDIPRQSALYLFQMSDGHLVNINKLR